jgi:hypothetical protein
MNFEEVTAWSNGIECFKRNDTQLWYSNPKTGVYFSFDFEAKAPQSPDDGPDIPDGYFDSGLSLIRESRERLRIEGSQGGAYCFS